MKTLKFDFSLAEDRDAAKIAQRVFDYVSLDVSKAHSITVILHEIIGGRGRNPIYTGWMHEGQFAANGDLQLRYALAQGVADYIVKNGVNAGLGFACSGATVAFRGQLSKP